MITAFRVSVCAILLAGALPVAAAVWYVDVDNTATVQDGTSWAKAFTTISAAVAAARTYTDDEVWVAEGVYASSGDTGTGALVMKSNVDLFGGFAGSESSLAERDWAAHPTVIDGSTARDGEPAYHVVIADNALLDGFTITGGVAGGPAYEAYGGGLISFGATPRIKNCRFTGNTAISGGAVAALGKGSLEFENCTFDANSAQIGGALYADALVGTSKAQPAFRSPDVAVLILKTCTFSSNTAEIYAGAATAVDVDRIVFDRCDFDACSASLAGALGLAGSTATIQDCVFTDNTAAVESGAGTTAIGGALYATSSTVEIRRSTLDANSAERGGAVYLLDTIAEVLTCQFTANSAEYGAGIYRAADTAKASGTLPITNTLFAQNAAVQTGAAIHDDGAVSLTHCTIADNGSGGSAAVFAKSITAENTILWDSYQLLAGGTFEASHCAVPSITPTNGNFSLDPAFADAENGDYSLTAGSPCIGQALPVLVVDASLSGVWRPNGANADVGAFEFASLPDSDGDGISDTLEVVGVDSDHDNVDDYLDLDSDSDGVPDALEGPIDPDTDGIANFRDVDSDADHMTDGREVASHLDPNDSADSNLNSDPDDDGLSSFDELTKWGTNALDRDTDNDGMPDGWEAEFGIGPLTPNAGGDDDNDGLPNAYEYRIGTSPSDVTDPPSNIYVNPKGSDAAEGTATAQLKTLTRAMTVAQLYSAAELYGIGTSPVTIHAAEGVYNEPLVFAPDVTLRGTGNADTKIVYPGSVATHTIVQAAAATAMYNCTVALADQTEFEVYLVRLDDADMTLENVVINGKNSPFAIGIYAAGEGTSGSALTNCTITKVRQGLHTLDSDIHVGNTTFSDISGDAVFVERATAKQTGGNVPLLGDIGTAGTKFNNFRNVVGLLVANHSYITVQAERCDWGIYHKADIKRKMLGPVDFTPFHTPSGELTGCAGGPVRGCPWGDILAAAFVIAVLSRVRPRRSPAAR